MKILACPERSRGAYSELNQRAQRLLTIPLGFLFLHLTSLPVMANGCVDTPIGCIPTDPGDFAGWILERGIYLGILVAILLIIISGFGIVSSTGDPERLAEAKSQLTAAVTGLLFILFSVIILRIIGGIIGIPLFQ